MTTLLRRGFMSVASLVLTGGPAERGAPGQSLAIPVTERRRSRTDRAWGYHTAQVLKTCWATGPMPLRT